MSGSDGTDGSRALHVPRLIVGLGNPGDTYRDTRHNIGFMVIDELARRLGISFTAEKRWDCLLAKFAGGWLLKPLTFMNASGDAAGAAARFFKVQPRDTLAIHDDVDLPLGRLRIRKSGSPAGHNGVKSVIAGLGTEEFGRLKIGIGEADGRPGGHRMSGHVLGKFRPEEKTAVDAAIQRAADAAMTALQSGLDAAMNHFNRKEDTQTQNTASA